MANKLRAVKGELPKKRDIIDWPEEKILALVSFTEFFLTGESFAVTDEKREAMRTNMAETPYFEEFMTRIEGEHMNRIRFQKRLLTMLRTMLSWLKQNSYAITEDMRARMQGNARFSWCLQNFKTVETKIGGELVVMDNRETTDPSGANRKPDVSNVKTPQVRFNQALMDLTSVFELITRSIKQKDIRDLSTKEKLRMAVAIAATLTKTYKEYKPNITVLQQINVNQAERDDLEKALYDFSEAQDLATADE